MANVLLVTVTKVEASTVLKSFYDHTGVNWKREYRNGKAYYDLGQLGGVNILMVRSEMGSLSPGAALVTILRAIEDISPKAIILVGTAFGLKPKYQKIGDILVSCHIRSYEQQKVYDGDLVIPRGDRVSSSQKLLGLFRDGDLDWTGVKVHFGVIFSGEKLITSSIFREKLLSIESEAIGGEMEGAGLYTAASEAKIDWILVKAICDWADEAKSLDSQQLAAQNAIDFVIHVIKHGGLSNSFRVAQGIHQQLFSNATANSQPGSDSIYLPMTGNEKVNTFELTKEYIKESEYRFSGTQIFDSNPTKGSNQNPFIPFLVRVISDEKNKGLQYQEIIQIQSSFCYWGRSKSSEHLDKYVKTKKLDTSNTTIVLLPALLIAKGNSCPTAWMDTSEFVSYIYSGWGNRKAQENIEIVDMTGNIHALTDNKPYALHGFEIIRFSGEPQVMHLFIPRTARLNNIPPIKYLELVESVGLWASAGYGWLIAGQVDRALISLEKAIRTNPDDVVRNNILGTISKLRN